ncbi:hypothetical protein BSKO_02343 [Bryopsis sp. KO-2023]|nr:hypothetical protein BSKO_02343 [Bryopsis sp. KO-2023]
MPWLDFFGYTPARQPRYRTCCGCALSLGVILGTLWGAIYYLYIFSTASYRVKVATVPSDLDFVLSPNGDPQLPEVGVAFRLRDGTFVSNQGVVDVVFRQRYAVSGFLSKDPELQDFRIPAEPCVFSRDSVTRRIDSYCPKWGRTELRYGRNGFQRKKFIAASSRSNATAPEIQGQPHAERYAFLQATVSVDLVGVEDDPDISVLDIFKGSVVFHVATKELELDDLNIRSNIKKRTNIMTRSMAIKHTSLAKFDVEFSQREISRRSTLGNVVFFENTHKDVVVNEVKEGSDDMAYGPKFTYYNKTSQTLHYGSDVSKKVRTPRQFALAQIYFRMSDESKKIEMAPPLAVLDVMSSIGGVLIFFLACCAAPALLLNRRLFNMALKRADDNGTLPAIAFDMEGNMKPTHIDKVVEMLDSNTTDAVSRLRSRVVPNINLGSFQFHTPKAPSRGPARQKSIFSWS